MRDPIYRIEALERSLGIRNDPAIERVYADVARDYGFTIAEVYEFSDGTGVDWNDPQSIERWCVANGLDYASVEQEAATLRALLDRRIGDLR